MWRNFHPRRITWASLEWKTDKYVGKTTFGSTGQRFGLLKQFSLQATWEKLDKIVSLKASKCTYSPCRDDRHQNNKHHSEELLLPAPQEHRASSSSVSKRNHSKPLDVSPCNTVGHKISTHCLLVDYLAGSSDFYCESPCFYHFVVWSVPPQRTATPRVRWLVFTGRIKQTVCGEAVNLVQIVRFSHTREASMVCYHGLTAFVQNQFKDANGELLAGMRMFTFKVNVDTYVLTRVNFSVC